MQWGLKGVEAVTSSHVGEMSVVVVGGGEREGDKEEEEEVEGGYEEEAEERTQKFSERTLNFNAGGNEGRENNGTWWSERGRANQSGKSELEQSVTQKDRQAVAKC